MFLRLHLLVLAATLFCAPAYGQWQVVNEVAHSNPDSFYGIVCADSQHCIAFGDASYSYPRVKRSTDGGRTWTWVLNPQPDLSGQTLPLRPISAAHPTPDLMLLSVAHRRMLRSTNAGETWDTLHLNDLPENWEVGGRVKMFDATSGILMYGAGEHAYRTGDGGASWVKFSMTPLPSDRMLERGTLFFSPDEFAIFAAKLSGDTTWFYRTTDGGSSWMSSTLPVVTPFGAFAFSDREHGWAIGGNNTATNGEVIIEDIIARTTDGGSTWTVVLDSVVIAEHTPQSFGLFAIDAVDADNALAVGHRGKILRTTDAGATWRTESSTLSLTGTQASMGLFRSVVFTGATTAIIGGWESVILRYEPGVSGLRGELVNQTIVVSPNPASQTLRVVLPATVTGAGLTVQSILGETIISTRMDGQQGDVDTSGLAPGRYLLVVEIGGTRQSVPLVIAR